MSPIGWLILGLGAGGSLGFIYGLLVGAREPQKQSYLCGWDDGWIACDAEMASQSGEGVDKDA